MFVSNIAIEPHAKADNAKRKIEDALKRHAEMEARDMRVTVRDDSEVLFEARCRAGKVAVENAAWLALPE